MRYGLKERLLGTGLLIALAVIFIPFLFDPKPTPPQLVEKQTLPPKPAPIEVQVEEAVLPELPPSHTLEEKTLIQKLATTAKANDVLIKAEGGVEAWAVQIASFKESSNAERLVAQQTAEHQPAYWRKINNMAVVFIGPYLTRQQADDKKAELAAKGTSTLVIKYVPEYLALKEGSLPTSNPANATNQTATPKQPAADKPRENSALIQAEAGAEAWGVQIASFQEINYALRLVAKQKEAQEPVYWRTINGRAVVFLGPYLTLDAAETKKAELAAQGTSSLVIKYQPERQLN